MKTIWNDHIDGLNLIAKKLIFTDTNGVIIETEKAFEILFQWSNDIRNSNKTLYAIGNGASASIASHFTADLAKNGKLHTQVFSEIGRAHV